MIPKIIHYCWLSADSVPEEFNAYIDGWHRLLPDYEFIKWDFSRFDKTLSEWVSEAFDKKKYAFAADYIRLYAVYNYGGIYLDMDIEVIKSFDSLLDKEYMFATEKPNRTAIEAGCFGAEKGNLFIGKCLDRYKGRHFILEDGSFDMTPLPQIMESVRATNKIKLNLYPWTYFTAKSYDTGIVSPNDDTYCIHHFAGSSKTEREKGIIQKTHSYSKILGSKIGHNVAEYQDKLVHEGIYGAILLTKEKIQRKVKGSR